MKINDRDERHIQAYAENIKKAREKNGASFQSWFDTVESVEQAAIQGYWDFSFHILTRSACSLIEKPHEKTCLEIGYGGGRLLNAACSFFKHAIGVDIHLEQEVTSQFIKSQGKNNFHLLKGSGSDIPAENNSIDFIYSFIVLQHLQSFLTLEKYIKESYRCLKPGGIAQLYIGKYGRENMGRIAYSPANFLRHFIHGFSEFSERVDETTCHVSLVVAPWKAILACKKIGFSVAGYGHSYKRIPDGYPARKGGQFYLTLIKPAE